MAHAPSGCVVTADKWIEYVNTHDAGAQMKFTDILKSNNHTVANLVLTEVCWHVWHGFNYLIVKSFVFARFSNFSCMY